MVDSLADLIRLELHDPRVKLVTLTGVDLTADYAHAKVHFTVLADARALAVVKQGLDRASGFLRRELGKRVRIHTLPQLHFVHDASVENGIYMSRLIDEAVSADRAQQQ